MWLLIVRPYLTCTPEYPSTLQSCVFLTWSLLHPCVTPLPFQIYYWTLGHNFFGFPDYKNTVQWGWSWEFFGPHTIIPLSPVMCILNLLSVASMCQPLPVWAFKKGLLLDTWTIVHWCTMSLSGTKIIWWATNYSDCNSEWHLCYRLLVTPAKGERQAEMVQLHPHILSETSQYFYILRHLCISTFLDTSVFLHFHRYLSSGAVTCGCKVAGGREGTVSAGQTGTYLSTTRSWYGQLNLIMLNLSCFCCLFYPH